MFSKTTFNFAESDISDFDNILQSSNRNEEGQTSELFDHIPQHSVSNARRILDVNLKQHDDPFDVGHTRDFYKGTSFRGAGKWKEGVHYLHDTYVIDFCCKDNVFLMCKQSHMSSAENEPKDWIEENGLIVGVDSEYWEVIVSGPNEDDIIKHVILSESEWEEISDPDPNTIYMIYEE